MAFVEQVFLTVTVIVAMVFVERTAVGGLEIAAIKVVSAVHGVMVGSKSPP